MDANADSIYSDIAVMKPTDELPPVDVIIVTLIYYFIDIEKTGRESHLSNIIIRRCYFWNVGAYGF